MNSQQIAVVVAVVIVIIIVLVVVFSTPKNEETEAPVTEAPVTAAAAPVTEAPVTEAPVTAAAAPVTAAPVINGNWTTWTQSGDCDKECGPGQLKYTRSCTNPTPQNGGTNCDGEDVEYRDCEKKKCPIHGNYGGWRDKSKCSAECGEGIVKQRRYCDNPAPAHGGNRCYGTSYNDRICKLKECPVHGGWSGWTITSGCNKECGTGLMTRERNCNNPTPAHGGNTCSGNQKETIACNTQPCQIDKARYVKFFNDQSLCQNILQIYVYTKDGKNVALGKPTESSSVLSNHYTGNNLTDDNIMYSMAHTDCKSKNNWWIIDLQAEYLIDKIIVANRRGHSDRAIGAKISLLNNNKQVVFTSKKIDKTSLYYAFLPSKGAEIHTCGTRMCPEKETVNKTFTLKKDPGSTLFNGKLVNVVNNTGGSDAYLDSGGGLAGSAVKVWKKPDTNSHWELTSDRHIKSNVGNICISGKDNQLMRADCTSTPDQLWTYNNLQFKNDSGYYIKRTTTATSGAIESNVSPGSGWSIKNVKDARRTYSFGDLTVKDFKDNVINLGEKFNDWNPTFNQGIPAMDVNGKMVFISLVYDYSNSPWTLTWFENKVKQEFDLRKLFTAHVGALNAYNNYEGAAKIVFNILNEAFVLVNLNRLIRFDYKKKQWLQTIVTDNMGRIENKFKTNNPFHNNYPVLTNIKKPITVSLYNNGKYDTFKAPNFTNDMGANSYFSTIQHSGRNSATFTVHGKTFICFASMHGTKDGEFGTTGIPGKTGNPQWITVFNHFNKTWSVPVLLGYGGEKTSHDTHNAPSIMITSKGIIYVFFGNHHDLCYYVKSSGAYNITTFGSPIQLPGISGQTSSRKFTYPACNIDSKDNIYVTYRGPWYAFSLWKINTNTNQVTGKQIFDVHKPVVINGNQRGTGKITATNYAAWRDVMTIDLNDNLYIFFHPKAHTDGWAGQPHSLTGAFVLISTDGGVSFKIIE